MVLLTRILWRKTSDTVKRYDQKWVDRLRVYVRGGTGGNGLPKYGGIGGSGGNVVISASKQVQDLKKVLRQNPTKRIIAGDGGHSRTMRLLGEPGQDVELSVPPGVSIVTDEGQIIGDLFKHGDSVTVARGGMGGIESSNFLGTPGERKSVRLDLKLLGDVGFVGFPNAGKSTLLKAISRAKPKIASYPFTTIKPNIGHAEFPDFRRITFADLPGLIEGAHANEGMGHAFLKHVERTRVLMLVVDVNGFQFRPHSPLRSALETILILNRELELYRSDLLDKPAILVVTKMDSKGAERTFESLREDLNNFDRLLENSSSQFDSDILPARRITFSDVVPVSAKFSPKTVDYLKWRVRDVIDYHELEKAREAEAVLEADLDRTLADKTNIF